MGSSKIEEMTATVGESAIQPAIRLRRSHERGFEDFGWTDNWLTFCFGGYYDPDWVHFGPLRVIVENHIQPHQGFGRHPHRDVEIVTYVSAGTLTHRDSFGYSAGVTAGEMQVISAGARGMIHSETNEHDQVEHNLQIWLIPDRRGTEFRYGQLKFTPEERQGRFRLYVSPDGRDGSLPVNTQASIWAGLFRGGDRCEQTVGEGNGIWLQVVKGEVTAEGVLAEGVRKQGEGGGIRLGTGDGVGITNLRDFALQFTADTELLMFELGMDSPMLWK